MKTLDDVASQINEYVGLTSALAEYTAEMNLQLNASPFYNFRDALNHYVKLYEASKISEDSPDFYSQISSIEEHLFRGLKDMILYISNELKYRIIGYKNTSFSSLDKQNEIRIILHKHKNFELNLRKNSEAYITRELLSHIDSLRQLVDETFTFFDKNGINYLKTKRNF